MDKSEIRETANKLATAVKVLELQTHLLDRVNNPSKIGKGEFQYHYCKLYEETNTLFELNQDLMKSMDEAAALLYELGEENEADK